MAQPQTDIVLGFFDEDGNGVVRDYFANGYSSPVEDEMQDIIDPTIERKNGITTFKFKRNLTSVDKKVGIKSLRKVIIVQLLGIPCRMI